MLFGYFTLLVALTISVVAEFYSIVGLMAIFAASPIATAIMGGALGVGKVTAAVWLKLNWDRARWTYKAYLVPAVIFLMFITSMGILGFLSKAHSDQSLVSGDVQSKIAIYDEKIKTEKENIEANRKALKQMDEGVDRVLGRSTDEKGADKAVALRRSQQKERARLQNEISQSQKSIAELNDARAPIAAEVRKVEAEVGPIKYIAALIYGDNPDANLLESAVRWVIILIVAVFDPLALMLILSAQQSLRWAQEDRVQEEFKPDAWVADVGEKPTPEELDEIESVDPHPPGWMFDKKEEHTPDEVNKHTEPVVENNADGELSILEQHPYLNKHFAHFQNLTPMVYKPEPQQSIEIEPVPDWGTTPITDVERPGDYLTPAEEPAPYKVPETTKRVKAPMPVVPETLNVRKKLQADNVETKAIKSSFGTAFPDNAEKGDMFLRVDYLPNKLFKYNASKWIEVDKSKTDSYTYDEQYIQYLIEKLQSGEYEIDQLSAGEQDLVAEKLQQKNDNT